ncbi:MAG TPA: alpha/beta hydrolase [Caulobacteraceae bacterium]
MSISAETAGRLESDGAAIAWRRVAGRGPTLLWLGGFRSEMSGAKASALAGWAASEGRAFLRFDYFGHGVSEGRFEDGDITRWRADALAALDGLVDGPAILVGSSMGGWLACLVALARPAKVAGLALIAPAADFTERLIAPELPSEAHEALRRDGVWRRPSAYDPGGYPITRRLLEDGARWSILPGPIPIVAPVRILQGGADAEVPWRHALDLALALKAEDVVFSLIRDGDHRLSRPQDLARLAGFAAELADRP